MLESPGPLPDFMLEAEKSIKPSEMDPKGESNRNKLSGFERHFQERCEAAELMFAVQNGVDQPGTSLKGTICRH